MTSQEVISKLKQHFARHGIPEKLYSDNGPQLVSRDFKNFCKSWNIIHNTSSPGNSKANGAAEASVKIAKNLMKKCQVSNQDPYLALLNLRNTPQEGIESTPTQRIFGRRTRTILPTKTSLLDPALPKKELVQQQLMKRKERMIHYDKGKDLPHLKINDNVRIQPIQNPSAPWKPGKVVDQVNPRSYIVRTEDNKELRRDRQFLRKQKEPPSAPSEIPVAQVPEDTSLNEQVIEPRITTRSGRVIKQPNRLVYS